MNWALFAACAALVSAILFTIWWISTKPVKPKMGE